MPIFNLPDSGERRSFQTGSVRDLSEGKGRVDLVPNNVVSAIYTHMNYDLGSDFVPKNLNDLLVRMFRYVDTFIYNGEEDALIEAIISFSIFRYGKIETSILEVARHFEAGAKKYEDRNWEKGQPLHVFIDSALRHLLKYGRGDQDEPHDSAFLWNLYCALWTLWRKPDLIDLPFNEEYKFGK